MFDRKKPCKTCPFLTNGDGLRHLGEERAQEIADSLMGDCTFSCHDDLELLELKRQHCVGAMIMLEKQDRPNQMMRISERLGLYDRHALTGHENVFDDFEDWVECQAMD